MRKHSLQPASIGKLGTAFLTWRRYLQRQVTGYNITLKQLSVLRRLTSKECMHPSEVAKLLFCDRPTATVIINNMRKYGWVETKKDPVNRKYQQIFLTSKGLQKVEEINASEKLQPGSLFDPLACFTEAEKMEFERLLEKLNQHLMLIGEENENENENE